MHYRIRRFQTIDSTNDRARVYAEQGAPEGLVLIAQHQTKGRGRFRRRWRSVRGKDILLSILLRPSVSVNRIAGLTYHAARAVKRVLETCGVTTCRIKAPNDVLVGRRKICGILTESKSTHHAIEYVIIGIGCNINSTRPALLARATSLREVTGVMHNRERIIHMLLKIFKEEYAQMVGNTL